MAAALAASSHWTSSTASVTDRQEATSRRSVRKAVATARNSIGLPTASTQQRRIQGRTLGVGEGAGGEVVERVREIGERGVGQLGLRLDRTCAGNNAVDLEPAHQRVEDGSLANAGRPFEHHDAHPCREDGPGALKLLVTTNERSGTPGSHAAIITCLDRLIAGKSTIPSTTTSPTVVRSRRTPVPAQGRTAAERSRRCLRVSAMAAVWSRASHALSRLRLVSLSGVP